MTVVVSSGTPTPTATPTPTTSPTTTGVSVPNVYGMQSSAAEQELTALGLQAAYRTKPNTGQPSGTVVNIRPDAGTVVQPGRPVLLVIAS